MLPPALPLTPMPGLVGAPPPLLRLLVRASPLSFSAACGALLLLIPELVTAAPPFVRRLLGASPPIALSLLMAPVPRVLSVDVVALPPALLLVGVRCRFCQCPVLAAVLPSAPPFLGLRYHPCLGSWALLRPLCGSSRALRYLRYLFGLLCCLLLCCSRGSADTYA